MYWIQQFVIVILIASAFTAGYGVALAQQQSRESFVVEQAKNLKSGLFGSEDVPSPKDRVPEDRIHVFPNQVLLDIRGAQWSRFTDTNSMDPVIDNGSNAIQIIPQSADDIQVGDIISYDSEYGTIIHRVAEVGNDKNGWYAIAKGDNNPTADPFKIRFSQIKRVVVGIVY
ncbi:MAG: signal peptidase I [Candidatus Aenigmarchaeota archaeon]|nr:signal peptidase I [Candidatus Aenigmarchaeota archaeon]